MKHIFIILMILVGSLTSCSLFDSTLTLTPARMNRITTLVQTGSKLGGIALLNEYPGYREGLAVASDALEALVAGDQFDPDHINDLLRRKLDDELRDPVVEAVYEFTLDLVVTQYRVFWEENKEKLQEGNWRYAVAFLDAARLGLDAALRSGAKSDIPTTPNPLEQVDEGDLKL